MTGLGLVKTRIPCVLYTGKYSPLLSPWLSADEFKTGQIPMSY